MTASPCIDNAKKMIKGLLADGLKPSAYRNGIAKACGLSVDQIDALIAESGAPAVIDPETVALRRLRDEGQMRRENRHAYNEMNHEEN